MRQDSGGLARAALFAEARSLVGTFWITTAPHRTALVWRVHRVQREQTNSAPGPMLRLVRASDGGGANAVHLSYLRGHFRQTDAPL